MKKRYNNKRRKFFEREELIMLAKVWKKVLLAICIIACIYNVMHKLVSRTSLEFQLESVRNQSSIIDMLDTNSTNLNIQNSSVENKNSSTVKNSENHSKNDAVVVVY